MTVEALHEGPASGSPVRRRRRAGSQDLEVLQDLYRLAVKARRAREESERAELAAVRAGRVAGRSWDSLGGFLGVPGETLRRRYAGAL